MGADPAAVADVVLFTGVACAVGAALLAGLDWWLEHRSDNEPEFESVPLAAVDLHAADDFFHPTGRPGALVALAREGHVPETSETRTVAAAGSRTIKGVTNESR